MVLPQAKGPGRRPARRARRLRPALDLLEPRVAPASGLAADLPIAARYAVSGAIGRSGAEYAATAEGGSIVLANPDNGYEASVAAEGFRIASGADSWSFALRGIGYGGTVRPLGAATVSTDANRVEYDHGAVTQWFVNGPLGLQQGFTLDARPEGSEAGGPLTILLGVDGVVASADPGAASVTLARPDGAPVASYGGLVAYDAAGRSIPAAMIVDAEGAALAIVVDDAEAVYPLVVDPYVQSSSISVPDFDGYRLSTAISSDGQTLAVASSTQNQVLIFEPQGEGWVQTAKLQPSIADTVTFGVYMSLSGDGSTLVVDSMTRRDSIGRYQAHVYLFDREGRGWSSPEILTIGGPNPGGFATAVGTNGDGRLVGVATAEGLSIYERALDGWQLADQLPATDAYAPSEYGGVMEFDDAGENLVVGAAKSAAAYFYSVDDDGKWSEAGVATWPEAGPYSQFGSAAAMSGDGTTALVGGGRDDSVAGRSAPVQVYSRAVDGRWIRTGELTAEMDPTVVEGLSGPVAISRDGKTAAVTAIGRDRPWDPALRASNLVYVFARTADGWAPSLVIDSPNPPRSGVSEDHGISLALSDDLLVVGTSRRFSGEPRRSSFDLGMYPIFSGLVAHTGPFIGEGASDLRVASGRSATFTATAYTTAARIPNYTARWETSLDDGRTWIDFGVGNTVAIGSTTQTWLTVPATVAASGRLFRAVFADPATGKEVAGDPARLTVFDPGVSVTAQLGMNPRPLGAAMTINVRVASRDPLAGTLDGVVRLIVGPFTLEGFLDRGTAVFAIPESLGMGTYTITVEYAPSDGGGLTRTVLPDRLVVDKAWSSLSLESPLEAIVGDGTTLTAVLGRSSEAVPASGGVVLMDGGVPIAFEQVAVIGGRIVATFSTRGLAVGDHYFQLVYLGVSTTSAAASGVYRLTIKPEGATADRSPAPTVGSTAPSTTPPSGIAPAPTPAAPDPLALYVVEGEEVILPAGASGGFASIRWMVESGGRTDELPGETRAWLIHAFSRYETNRRYFAILVGEDGEETPGASYAIKVLPRPVYFQLGPLPPRTVGGLFSLDVAVSTFDPKDVPGGPIHVSVGGIGFDALLDQGRARLIDRVADRAAGPASVTVSFGDQRVEATQAVMKKSSQVTVTAPAFVQPWATDVIRVSVRSSTASSNPTGGVLFLDNGRPIALVPIKPGNLNEAELPTRGLALGDHYLQMVYLGDPFHSLASSGVFRITVGLTAPSSAPLPAAAAADSSRGPSVGAAEAEGSPLALEGYAPPDAGRPPTPAVAATAAPSLSMVPAAPIRPRVVDPAAGPVGARKWGLLEGGSGGEG